MSGGEWWGVVGDRWGVSGENEMTERAVRVTLTYECVQMWPHDVRVTTLTEVHNSSRRMRLHMHTHNNTLG